MMFFLEKESIGKEEPSHQARILGWLEENKKGEDTIKKELWQSEKEKVSLSEQLSVKSLASPYEKPFVEMGESLLDCIIKESPIKDVSYFLTQTHGSLFKIYPSFSTEELSSGEDNLNLAGKVPSPTGDMAVTGQQLDPSNTCRESNNNFCPDSSYENFMYKPALMQSNREVKRTNKNCVIQCSKRGRVHRKFPSESEVPKADKKSLHHHSETSLAPKEEYKQGGTSNKVILSTHKTGSPCLSPYEASSNMFKTQYSKYNLEKLPFQEEVTNFSGVIKELEQGQQKQTQITDLQCDDKLLKKIKERGKLLLREGDYNLNEVTKRMKRNQKKQPTQITDSYSETISLETSLKELESKAVQQWHFEETVNKLKKDIEDLREGRGKVTKEKNEARNWLVVMQEALSNATKHLEEVGIEKKALLQQVEELKSAYCLLQKKHEAELKTKYLQRDHTICRKEKKIRELQHLKQKLEQEAETVTSALHGLRKEKQNTEKGLLSLQTKFQGGKDGSLAERQQPGSKYNKLAAQLKILQVEFENEQAEREKMQQQIYEFRIENQKLQQQSAKDQEQNHILQLETARWKKKYDKVRESQTAKLTSCRSPQIRTQIIFLSLNITGRMKQLFNCKKK
ncbi:cancer-associated gene 1 protein isoform X2 [Rhea pennata]